MRRLAVRVAGVAAVVVGATACAWLLVHLLRPDAFRSEDGALPVRLGDFLNRAFLHFDFGMSAGLPRQPVATLIRDGLPADVSLLAGGLAFGVAAGGGIALLCARRPRGVGSRALQGLAMVAMCAPVYVVGLSALLLFGAQIGTVGLGFGIPLDYVPFRDDPLGWLGSLLAPWVVLGLPLAGMVARVMLGELVEVAGEDYVRAARAKGLSERAILRRHVAPAALGPTAMLASAATPLMLTNLVLVERVFSVPGVFRDFTRAIGTANYPLIFGTTAVGAALIGVTTLVFDLFLHWLDPRVRASVGPGLIDL
jgi:peptide/nickel transport system permease protein